MPFFHKTAVCMLMLLMCLSTGCTAEESSCVTAKTVKAAEQGDMEAQRRLGDAYSGKGCVDGVDISPDDAQAVVWYRKAAEQGQAEAQLNLGVAYWTGTGVSEDDAEAMIWFRQAAEQGNAKGQFALGMLYQGQDDAEAMVWYRKAAEQGHAEAQNSVGWMYWAGRGVNQDHAEAVVWYRKAAEQGNINGQFNLGVMYDAGNGVSQDDAEAMVWYRKAAEQGHAEAQFKLAVGYFLGTGVNLDEAEGEKWLREAVRQGNESAIALLEAVEEAEREMAAREQREREQREREQREQASASVSSSSDGIDYGSMSVGDAIAVKGLSMLFGGVAKVWDALTTPSSSSGSSSGGGSKHPGYVWVTVDMICGLGCVTERTSASAVSGSFDIKPESSGVVFWGLPSATGRVRITGTFNNNQTCAAEVDIVDGYDYRLAFYSDSCNISDFSAW